jgi:hypothetical protein
MLFTSYRTDQYPDPDAFMASLGLVLEQYPDDVIVYVTDPRTGVQRRCKWPPTIPEIVEALDDRSAWLKRRERYENWGKNNKLMVEGPIVPKPTLEEMQEKYGKDWGLNQVDPDRGIAPVFTAPSWDKVTADYASDPSRIARLTEKSK